MNTSSLRLFISHSSRDHQFCERLVNDLRGVLGTDAVWYDALQGLHGGDTWWSNIVQELSTRNIFIVVLSPEAVTSKWVKDEINIAWRRKNEENPTKQMRLIPVLYQTCEIPYDLGSLQIINFVFDYKKAFGDLLQALEIPTSPSMNQATQQAPITTQKTNEEQLPEKNSRKRKRKRTLTPQKTNEEQLQALELLTSTTQKTNQELRLQMLGLVTRTFNARQQAPITPQKTKEQWVDEGNTHCNAQQYEQAIADYDRAIELDPQYANAYYNRGLAHYHIGYFDKYEKAIADYSRAIQLDPNLAIAHYSRGFVYYNLKQYEKAIADYSRAIQLDPNLADAYLQRGFVYQDLKQYEKAILDWNRALQLAPQYTVVYKHRAGAYFALGLYLQAIADYDRAIELEPQYTALQGMREKARQRLMGNPAAFW